MLDTLLRALPAGLRDHRSGLLLWRRRGRQSSHLFLETPQPENSANEQRRYVEPIILGEQDDLGESSSVL